VLGTQAAEQPSGSRVDRRAARREATKGEILDAAWSLAREHGLAALSMRELAAAVDMRAPSLYQYFDSKLAIYDSMFGDAATRFAQRMAEPFDCDDPRQLLVEGVRRFCEFCTSDPVRYQLLFQRTVPGFEASAESYASSVRALASAQYWLARNGITEPRHLDMLTALVTGLVDQQFSNDPGGDRWTRLIDESMTMFLAHCQSGPASRKRGDRPTHTDGGPS
jgi:AcrR family transcriptional regulator